MSDQVEIEVLIDEIVRRKEWLSEMESRAADRETKLGWSEGEWEAKQHELERWRKILVREWADE